MKQPGPIQRFFILCSGANREIIYQCPTEWNKYAGIGATIFFTGLLASLSGGYALYTIFRGSPYALTYAFAFGILWGFVILNLDRFIVSSIKKEGNLRKELLYSLPRFILAIIISVVIAKPLEVKIFESRIEQQILEDKRKKLEDEKLSIDKLNDITALDNTITKKSTELKNLDSLKQGDPLTAGFRSLLGERNAAQQASNAIAERNNPRIADYNAKIRQVTGNGNNYNIKTDSTGKVVSRRLTQQASKEVTDLSYSRNELSKAINIAQQRAQDLDAEVKKQRNDYQATIAQRAEDKRAEIEQTVQTKAKADSVARTQFDESVEVKERSYTNNFITQLEALSNLTSSQSTMWWTSWLIMLLFIVIEISPVLVKILSSKGPYDDMLNAAEYAVALEENRKIEELKSTIDALMESARKAAEIAGATYISTKEDELKAQLAQNKDILEKVAACQKELADKYIDAWFEEEKAKIKGNVKNMSQKAIAVLEEIFWRQVGAPDRIEYFFRNGSLQDNELIYSENKKVDIGKWSYNSTKDGIVIELMGQITHYKIAELNPGKLKLQEQGTPDMLEFEKV